MDLFDRIAGRALEALPDRGMLRIDGADPDAGFLRPVHHDRTGGDEGFLVREGDGLPRPDRGEGRTEPAESYQGGKDDIDIPGNESADGIHPRMDLCRRPGEGSPDFLPL